MGAVASTPRDPETLYIATADYGGDVRFICAGTAGRPGEALRLVAEAAAAVGLPDLDTATVTVEAVDEVT